MLVKILIGLAAGIEALRTLSSQYAIDLAIVNAGISRRIGRGAEAEALFAAGMPGPAAELGLGGELAAARLKVLAALPHELQERATRAARLFHLDTRGWFRAEGCQSSAA